MTERLFVPEARLELASCKAYASETYVYTSSTIRALKSKCQSHILRANLQIFKLK